MMAFAKTDMAAAQDAAPRVFKHCKRCGKKGVYTHCTIIGSKRVTYTRCKYCGTDFEFTEVPI